MSTVSTKPAQDRSAIGSVYRYSRGQKAFSIIGFTVVVLLAVLEWTGGGQTSTYFLVTYPVFIGLTFLGVVNALKSTVEIGEDALRLRRPLPLQRNKSVRWSEVQRMRLKAAGNAAYLYTDLDGDPALTIGEQFERFREMAAEIADRLPDGTEITDPAGTLEGQRHGHGDADR